MSTPTFSESEDRYDLLGWDLVRRDTGERESFLPVGRDEIDLPGYVEHSEGGYEGSDWEAVRVYRTRVRPATLESALSAVGEYVGLVERIHDVYRHLVMDTEEDRALHARHVAQADEVLALVKTRLGLTDATTSETASGAAAGS